MWEWLSTNWWAVWLIVATLLALTESLTLDFTLLMLAAGALAGAGIALIFPGMILVQVIVAVAVAFAMLFLLRPTLLERVRSAPGYRSSLQRMVGSTGRAMTAITGSSGEVKVNGEMWQARSFGDVEIEAGASVEIFEVDGITVVVYPKEP
ncbi:MAG TPA: NfeD family protein [Micropruina sp.]|nr:NfeD family protein [Propionibacterium sp.]HMQ37471.1 NfeD family protein [Micropruina sp.]HMR22178.1 NfeD family protein [Micropruina sp.]